MKRNIIKSIIPALFAGLALVGCFPEDELTYNGPTVVEFKNHTLGVQASVLAGRGVVTTAGTQSDSTRTVLLNTRVTDTVYVQLVGPQRPEATSVNFSVRASSTAVEGTHYNFNPSGARQVTIPANSSVGYLLVNMVPNSIATVGASVRLDIDLTGGTDLPTSPKFDVFKITIRR